MPNPKKIDWHTLQAKPNEGMPLDALVMRNTTFEIIASATKLILDFCGQNVSWSYSSYDNTFSQLEQLVQKKKWAFVLFWVDWGFLENQDKPEATKFIKSTFSRISNSFDGYVFVNTWRSKSSVDLAINSEINNFQKIIAVNVEDIALMNEIDLFNKGHSELTTSCFSKQFDVAAARSIACSILPAVLGVQLRGLIIDLDGTMYNGLLGENGPTGIVLTEWHKRIWQKILELKNQGLLLAVSSKNNSNDVEKLFSREDLPLKVDDFAVIAANWQSKIKNINDIITAFNFSEENVLFIDDNPNELFSVSAALPKLRLFKADESGQATFLALNEYPGLKWLKTDDAAKDRTRDIQANFKRKELAEKYSGSNYNYLKELDIKIEINRDSISNVSRLSDLANKTNQFNLTFKRTNESAIKSLVQSKTGHSYTLTLSDRFADSGIVGGAIVRQDKNIAFLEEYLFSCRALGRGAETYFLREILYDLIESNVDKIEFTVVKGPKNQPALEWLSTLNLSEGVTVVSIDDLIKKCDQILVDYPIASKTRVSK